MSVKRIPLAESEQDLLQAIAKKSPDWRERDRAQTILLLSAGQTVFSIAEQQNVQPETIRLRRRRWLKTGLASLSDQPRSGAPSKLSDAHRDLLKEWIDAEPLTCRVLVSRLAVECDVVVSANTLRNELKRMGYVWKRTHYSLKKSVIKNALNELNVALPN